MKYVVLILGILFFAGCGDDAKDGGNDTETDSGGTDSNATDNDSNTGFDSDTNNENSSDPDSDHDTNLDECADINWDVALKSVNILVLLDRSKSMFDWHMPADGTDTYATVVRQAVEYIVQQNTNAGTINFALNVFPSAAECTDPETGMVSSMDVQCQPASRYFPETASSSDAPLVEFARDTDDELVVSDATVSLIESALGSVNQCGGTPVSKSLAWALYYLEAEQMPAEDTYVILATDGAPNCNSDNDTSTCRTTDGGTALLGEQCLDDAAAYDAAKALRAAGYKTFVIGVGDAAQDDAAIFDEVMNGLAYFGATVTPEDSVPDSGTPYYYSAASPETLDAALEEITNEVVDCEYAVDWLSVPAEWEGNPVNKNCADVRLLGVDAQTDVEVEIGYTEDCTKIAGDALAWYWVETPGVPLEDIEALGNDYSQCANIQLCPTACANLTAKGGQPRVWSGVSAKFGCQPVVVPIVPE
ncbi:MAG: hypothetical protein JXX29_17455 [Deltaproteobacteria bacterium]|nr:hypothetical protein [Deltaproteobacteria bacterium]MBN2673471.1 hypothetical protein [Deltaproteobacteria bacterium]